MSDTYTAPSHGWTCFHCGETFTTPGTARDHFGASQLAEPGCALKVSLGGERGLLSALRKTEALLARYMEEDTDLHRAMHQMQSRHFDALMAAEEAGYARGLHDGMVPPAAHYDKEDAKVSWSLAMQLLKQAQSENEQCAYWFISALSKLASSHSQRPVIEVLALARHAMPTAAKQYADYVADKS